MKLLTLFKGWVKKAITRGPVSGTGVIWDSDEVQKTIEAVVSEATQNWQQVD